MGTAADDTSSDRAPEIDSIDNIEVWCDVCGHVWEPRKNPMEANYPECSNCDNKSKSKLYVDAENGTYDLTGSPADMQYAEADVGDSETLDTVSEGATASALANGENGQVKPDDFGLETEEDAKEDVQDIYEHTVASFPSWGRNSPKTSKIEQYLIERGESNLTPPSPAELREWTSTISGIGDDVARNVSANYEQELTNAIASGRIDRDDLQNVYSSTLAQIGDTEMANGHQQGAMSPQMAAALQQPQETQQQSSQSDMMERLVEQSDSLGPEAMLMREMDTDDMDPMTVMLLMERMDADTTDDSADVPDELSDALTGLADAVENINDRISTLEDRVDDTESGSSDPLRSVQELADMRDTMVELGIADTPDNSQAQQQGGGVNEEVSRTLSMLMDRIDGLEDDMQSSGGTSRDDLESHIGRILEQTNDPDQARDLLAIAGKTSVDPEVRKKELELEMQREQLDNKNDSLETLLDGFQKVADRASSSFADAIMSSNDESETAQRVRGDEPAQQQPTQQQQPQPQPQPQPQQQPQPAEPQSQPPQPSTPEAPVSQPDTPDTNGEKNPHVRECDNCATEFDVPPNQVGFSCPDCGSGLTKCEECQHPTDTPPYEEIEYQVCPSCFSNPVSVDDPECSACGWTGDADLLVGEVVFCDNCGVPLVLERTAAEVQQAAQQQQYLPEQSQTPDETDTSTDDVEEVIEETREVIESDSGIPDTPDPSEYEPAGGKVPDETETDSSTDSDTEIDAPPAPDHSTSTSDGEEPAEDGIDTTPEEESTEENDADTGEREDDKQDVHECECGREFQTKSELNGHMAHCDGGD